MTPLTLNKAMDKETSQQLGQAISFFASMPEELFFATVNYLLRLKFGKEGEVYVESLAKVSLAERGGKLPLPESIDINSIDDLKLAVDRAKNDQQRALLGIGAWYGFKNHKASTLEERATFKGKDINDLLTDVEQAIRNITDAIDPLQIPEPRWVRALDTDRPEGSRAHKLYTVTPAGLAEIQRLITSQKPIMKAE